MLTICYPRALRCDATTAVRSRSRWPVTIRNRSLAIARIVSRAAVRSVIFSEHIWDVGAMSARWTAVVQRKRWRVQDCMNSMERKVDDVQIALPTSLTRSLHCTAPIVSFPGPLGQHPAQAVRCQDHRSHRPIRHEGAQRKHRLAYLLQ